MPMYQAVVWEHKDECAFHPTFYMFFGFYKKTMVKGDGLPWYPVHKRYLGGDIWADMLPTHSMPRWPHNSIGSPYLEHMGVIKMKPPDFHQWIDGCFQTGPLWIGSSTPGQPSKARKASRRRATATGGGKGRGRGGPQQSRGAH